MSTKRDAQKERHSATLQDYPESSIDPVTSLRQGREDKLFGHYWTDFIKMLQNESSKNTEKEATSSETGFFKTSSQDPENISKRKAEEFVETEVSFPSEFVKEREVEGILEEREQHDSASGTCFSETEEIREKMQSRMEVPSSSKQRSTLKEASDKPHKDSENLSTSSSDTEVKQATKKQLGKSKKFASELLHCGNCPTTFSYSKRVLGKLMYMFRETEINQNLAFKCLACSVIINAIQSVKRHFENHIRKKNLYCMECQIKKYCGQVIYDLETFDIPVKPAFEESKPKFPKLSQKSVANLSRLSPTCAGCPTRFEGICGNIYRLYEIYPSETYKRMWKRNIFCCIICGKCYIEMRDIESHILHHFHQKDVFCRKCYCDVSSANLNLISSTQTASIIKSKRLVNFDTSLKIHCGKCKHYLCDSLVLEPVAVRMFQKSIKGDVLKIRSEELHKCVLCLKAFKGIEILKHIAERIKSNQIVCNDCQITEYHSFASISRISWRLEKYKSVRCTHCNDYFCKEDLRSYFSAFLIRRTENKQSTCEIFVCEFCKRALWSQNGITRHVIAHISKKQIFCNSCASKINIDERLLQQHD